jgi:hypothetical protein
MWNKKQLNIVALSPAIDLMAEEDMKSWNILRALVL